MKSLRTSILLFMLLFPLVANAQYSDFDLSRYKLPDIKINRLDAKMNMSNYSTTGHQNSYQTDSAETNNKEFRGMLNLDFYHYRNTENYQGSMQITAYGQLEPYSNDVEDYNSKINNVDFNFIFSDVNRFYRHNMNFIEVDPSLSIISSQSKYEFNNTSYVPYSTVQKYDNTTSTFSIPVSFGHGRIEQVQDVRLAIYILEELNKIGTINSMPEDEVVLSMAKVISSIKSERFFDNRLRKIKELQVVDSFLVANGIIKTHDINYFAVLNDQWDYASGPARSAGFSVDAGIDDHFTFNHSVLENSSNGSTTAKDESYTNTKDASLFFRAMYYKPVNLYWQTSLIFRTQWGYEFTKDPKDENNPLGNYTTNFFSSRLMYSIQYLPNSRTSMSLSLTGDFINQRGDRTLSVPEFTEEYQMKNNQFNINGGFNMYYYVSPQFRIQLDTYIYYNTQIEKYSNDFESDLKNSANSFHHDFQLTLIYSFF